MMKKLFALFFIFIVNITNSFSQSYPQGLSLDSVFYQGFFGIPNDTSLAYYAYKPSTYDPASSPILFAIHGVGGDGAGTISNLIDIAERRGALVIAPNIVASGCIRHVEAIYITTDSIDHCAALGPATLFFKKLYKHILQRENRTSMDSYLTGFSAGGQFVSRYMLIRQEYPDSIPIKMAVSMSAYFYSFPTDTFSGVAMPWLCGFIPPFLFMPGLYCLEMYSMTRPEKSLQY